MPSTLSNDADRLLSLLKVRHLRVVVALRELGSLVSVATRFHVTPAAISKTLAEVESVVGMTLFERSRYKLRATDAGLCMIAEAKLVLSQLERMSESLTSLGRGVAGSLAVGSATASAQPFIAEVLCLYVQQYPQVKVAFNVESSPKKAIQRLVDGDLDLLLDYTNNAYEQAGLSTYAAIPPQKLLVVGSKDHPLTRRTKPTAAQLHTAMWCIPTEWSRLRPHLETMFHKHGLGVPGLGISTSDLAMLQTMLQARDCLTIMPERVAMYLESHNLGRIIKFDTASQVERVDMIWSEKIRPRATASLFKTLALEVSKSSNSSFGRKARPR